MSYPGDLRYTLKFFSLNRTWVFFTNCTGSPRSSTEMLDYHRTSELPTLHSVIILLFVTSFSKMVISQALWRISLSPDTRLKTCRHVSIELWRKHREDRRSVGIYCHPDARIGNTSAAWMINFGMFFISNVTQNGMTSRIWNACCCLYIFHLWHFSKASLRESTGSFTSSCELASTFGSLVCTAQNPLSCYLFWYFSIYVYWFGTTKVKKEVNVHETRTSSVLWY